MKIVTADVKGMLRVSKNQKDVLVLAAGKAIQLTIGFATIRLITELLSEEQVGIYFTLQTLIMLLAFTFFNPLGQFYGRHLVHWQETNNIKNSTVFLIFLRLIAIPVALLFSTLAYYVFDYSEYFSIASYIAFIAIALLSLTHGPLLSAANVLIGRLAFTMYAAATLILGLIASCALAYFNRTAMSWMLGLFSSQIIFSILIYISITKENRLSISKIKSAINIEYIQRVIFFMAPVTVALFLQWGQSASFRLVVEDLYSAEVLAYIAVGMKISSAIFSALESLATQFYMPIYLRKITNASSQERAEAWNQVANLMVPIYISVAIYVIAFAPFLAELLVAEKFHDAYLYTMIGAAVEFFRAITNLVYLVSQSEVKTKNTVFPYLIGFLVTIMGLYTIDISTDFWKVPAILAVSCLLTLISMALSMKKLLSINLDWRQPARSILLTLPLVTINLVIFESTLINSIILLAFGGLYVLAAQYFLAKNYVKMMNIE